MATETRPAHVATEGFTVRPLDASELGLCRPLAARQLELGEREQIPEWLMKTTGDFGGVALGAFVAARLVGYSYALPGYDGGPFLLSCGLAVAPDFQGRGVGESLKRAQAGHARGAGYDRVRWTTNSLASRPLRLYLSKLGARLVRFRPAMYAAMREDPFPDEVEIEWVLDDPPAPSREAVAARTVTSSRPLDHGVRQLMDVDAQELRRADAEAYLVELPWDRGRLSRVARWAAERWVAGVREAMTALIARGYEGAGLVVERPAQRSFVRFERPDRWRAH